MSTEVNEFLIDDHTHMNIRPFESKTNSNMGDIVLAQFRILKVFPCLDSITLLGLF